MEPFPESSSPAPAGRPTVRPLLSDGEIRGRVAELGRAITAAYRPGDPLTVLAVMTGGMVFCADLIRRIDRPLQLGVLHARSYRGTRPGDLSVALHMLPDLAGRHVVVVDDIFDTGRTLERIVDEVELLGAASVEAVVLLTKDIERSVAIAPRWSGFTIGDEFVVGYGLDYDGEYRNRAAIGVLRFGDG